MAGRDGLPPSTGAGGPRGADGVPAYNPHAPFGSSQPVDDASVNPNGIPSGSPKGGTKTGSSPFSGPHKRGDGRVPGINGENERGQPR